MKILIINGPNLNLLGYREVEIYGNQSFDDYLKILKKKFKIITFEYFQSNIEGEIIGKIQQANKLNDAVIINAGGYSHTSVAICDAITYLKIPVVEVHISNVFKREDFRKKLLIAEKSLGCITGFGLFSYDLAVEALINFKKIN